MSDSHPRPLSQRRWVRLCGAYALSGIALVLVARFIVPKSSEVKSIAKVLSDADSWQIGFAGVLELFSISAFGLATMSLLRSRSKVSRRWMVALTMASTAIGNSLPLGAGVTTVYAYRKLVNRGISKRESGIAIGAANVVAIATLAFLVVFFTLISEEGSSTSVSPLTIGALLILVMGCAWVLWKIDPIANTAAGLWVYWRTRVRSPKEVARQARAHARAHAEPLQLSMSMLMRAFGFGLANWTLDLTALIVSLAVAGAHVSLLGVTSAYVVGALAANLPITPGGLGVVEGSLAVALVAFGGRQVQVLVGVLIYRLVSFWIWLPIGWTSHFVLSFVDRRRRRLSENTPGGSDRALDVQRTPRKESSA